MNASVATLLESLPYIREFHGKTVVIKYGGAAMIDEKLKEEFARDVCLLKFVGIKPVIVHGGGPDITRYMERLGMKVEFVDGIRVSDPETVEVAKMVLVGKVNKDIVLNLNKHGQPAVGLSGDDGSLLKPSKLESTDNGKDRDLGYVGFVSSDDVNIDVLMHIASDFIPVIASVGSDDEGNSYNVNADQAAGAVAGALDAYKLIIMTDVKGWLEDPEDESSLISKSSVDELEKGLEGDSVGGGMRPKLEACVQALRSGAGYAHIIDGRVEHSLLLELFTDAGVGTKIERKQEDG